MSNTKSAIHYSTKHTYIAEVTATIFAAQYSRLMPLDPGQAVDMAARLWDELEKRGIVIDQIDYAPEAELPAVLENEHILRRAQDVMRSEIQKPEQLFIPESS